MIYRQFKRQFTDNNRYGKFEKVPYMDALAHVVEEYVYSDKLDDDWFHFRMKEEIPLFDFMTLVAYFISESQQDFGKSTIEGYVEDLKAQYRGLRNNTKVEYPDNNLFVTCASYELIMGLLWTTYIYASACYMWSKNEKYTETASMVYGVMLGESGLEKRAFLESLLSKNAASARKLMLSYMIKSEVRNELKTEPAMKKPAEDALNLQARIKELEAELEKKNNDIEAYETQGKGVSASKNAILLTTLCHYLGGLPQNGRQSLSPILQKLYGYTEATATRALNQKFKQTDVDALAKLFSGISPRVGNAIIEMPSIIEKQNNERLRKLNEQKK